MYEEIIKTESEELIEIVNENFFTDMLSKNRKREVVDARRAYAKILRDRGYTFELISRTIGRDHATILYYVRTIDSILSYDKEFRDKYLLCKNAFLSNKENASIYKKEKDKDIYVTVVKLRIQLQKALSDKKEILNKFVYYIEEYENKTGYLPNIDYCRKTILPLFNE
jgi:hypothetical protein